MIARTLTLMGGLAGAAGLSQFPEFSQQYTQRLAGAVDELAIVTQDFDRSAEAEGMTRDEALRSLSGTGFADRRRADMTRTFARYEQLKADLDALRTAGPFTRATRIAHIDDGKIARQAARDYRPAAPLTFEGLTFGAVGLVLGSVAVLVLRDILSVLLWPFRRLSRSRPRRAS